MNAAPTHRTGHAPFCMLRLDQVTARTGLSRDTVYRMMRRGEFPASTKVGTRAVAWPEHEIEAWLVGRMAARTRVTQ